ncbi:hypothetical protein [Coxiella-like endosymbiont]|nr:hypothetical protein [Coxiella-like endosymbiont]
MVSSYGVGKPKSTYDNYFNFDFLFTPTAYSTDQQQAAEIYLQYLSQ